MGSWDKVGVEENQGGQGRLSGVGEIPVWAEATGWRALVLANV